jgi:hypothetical protein
VPERSYRAAIGQARHWRLQAEQPSSAALNIGFLLHLDGPLDAGALERALRDLLERHGVLRSTFEDRGGELWVRERPMPDWRLPVRDEPGADRAATEAILGEDSTRPFDLSEAVFRALLVRSGSHASLGLVFHHSVFDGWSMNVLFADLAALYNAYVSGRPSPLGEEPRPYADYAARQREAVESGAWEGQLAYWREQLRGVEPRPTLPRDVDPGPRPHGVALAAVALTLDSSRLVQRVARGFRTLEFVVLLAAYELMLAASSGVTDPIVGTPFVGRRHTEFPDTVGLFVNTVPMRARLGSDPTLGEVVVDTAAALRAGHSNQDIPLDRVMAEVLDEPSFSGLFDSLAQMQTARYEIPAFDGVEHELVPLWNVHTKYDLLVSFGRRGPGLAGLFEYNADAIREETLLGLATAYSAALAAVCLRPELRVGELLAELSGGEREPLAFDRVPPRDIPAVGLRSVLAEVDLESVLQGRLESFVQR